MASGSSSGHPRQANCAGSRAAKAPKYDVDASASASALAISLPFNSEQAARKSAAREQALAELKKHPTAFAWPAKKGQSSEQAQRQALKSIERGITRANQGPTPPQVFRATRPAELTRLKGITIPELSDDDPLITEPLQYGVEDPHQPID